MIKIVNLTPHDIRLFDRDGVDVLYIFPPSGVVARCWSERVLERKVDVDASSYAFRDSRKEDIGIDLKRIKIFRCNYTKAINLPPEIDGVLYLVSSLVAMSSKSRKDLISPDTSKDSVVRDFDGQIMGVRSFQVFFEE